MQTFAVILFIVILLIIIVMMKTSENYVYGRYPADTYVNTPNYIGTYPNYTWYPTNYYYNPYLYYPYLWYDLPYRRYRGYPGGWWGRGRWGHRGGRRRHRDRDDKKDE